MRTLVTFQLRVRFGGHGVTMSVVREQWHNDRRAPETTLLALEHYLADEWHRDQDVLLREWSDLAAASAEGRR